jgi:predicted RNA binding protein YcfA (HicA-like mRNA interferase family)
MPPKVRQLKAALQKAGFLVRPGKGSHTVWAHPSLPELEVTLCGKDGNDAEKYQIKLVQKALKKLGREI